MASGHAANREGKILAHQRTNPVGATTQNPRNSRRSACSCGFRVRNPGRLTRRADTIGRVSDTGMAAEWQQTSSCQDKGAGVPLTELPLLESSRGEWRGERFALYFLNARRNNDAVSPTERSRAVAVCRGINPSGGTGRRRCRGSSRGSPEGRMGYGDPADSGAIRTSRAPLPENLVTASFSFSGEVARGSANERGVGQHVGSHFPARPGFVVPGRQARRD